MNPRTTVASLVIAVIAGGCATAPGPSASDDRVRDDVRAFVSAVTRDLAARGPLAWLDHLESDASFFMATFGSVAFHDHAEAERFLVGFAPKVTHMDLVFDELRVEPIDADHARIGATFREAITMTSGTVEHFAGYATGVVQRRGGTWRFAQLHWSAPAVVDRGS